MAKAWRDCSGTRVQFHCPACDTLHEITDGPNQWKFNNDFDSPTIFPSIRVRWDFGEERTPKVCHSFVREGKIEYCSDCTHSLAGQTVDLPDDKEEKWQQ